MSHDRVKREEALAVYLALGPGRSVKKTRAFFRARQRPLPSTRTFDEWSSKEGWVEKGYQHDKEVGAIAAQQITEADEQEQFDAVVSLTRAAQYALDANRIKRAADRASERGDIAALMGAAEKALKLRELLTGGVTDRTEVAVETAKDIETANQFLRQIEVRILKAARAGPTIGADDPPLLGVDVADELEVEPV